MKGKTNATEVVNQDIVVDENGTYTADSGYSGIGSIKVNLQLKDETITTNGTHEVVPETNNYIGLSWWGDSKASYSGPKTIIGNYLWFDNDDPREKSFIGDSVYNAKIVDGQEMPNFEDPLATITNKSLSNSLTITCIPGYGFDVHEPALHYGDYNYIKAFLSSGAKEASTETIVGDVLWIRADSIKDIKAGDLVFNSTNSSDTQPDETAQISTVRTAQYEALFNFDLIGYGFRYPGWSGYTVYTETLNWQGYNQVTVDVPAAVIKNQDITAKMDKTYTHLSKGNHRFQGFFYPDPSLNGNYFWLEPSTISLGRSVYNTKTVDGQEVPDINNIYATITYLTMDDEDYIFKINTAPYTTFSTANSNVFRTVESDFTGLGTVTVKTQSAYLDGSGIFDNTYNSEVKSLRSYALYQISNLLTVTFPNCTILNDYCLASNWSLTTATLDSFVGPTLDETTGRIYNTSNGWNAFSRDSSLQTLNVPNMEIIPFGLLEFVDINIPHFNYTPAKLKGMYGSAFRVSSSSQKNTYQVVRDYGLNPFDMKFLGFMGDYLNNYIADPTNNITDTLTFNNLISIGDNFTWRYYSSGTNYLNQITTLNIPNVKNIEDYAAIEFSIVSVNLDNVIRIGQMAFKNSTLQTINIGNKVTTINAYAFSDCTGLQTININLPQDSIAGAPWGAPAGTTVNWVG